MFEGIYCNTYIKIKKTENTDYKICQKNNTNEKRLSYKKNYLVNTKNNFTKVKTFLAKNIVEQLKMKQFVLKEIK